MKKLLTAVFLSFVFLNMFGQEIEVKEYNAKILENRYPGFRVRISGNADHVESFLKKTLREAGKMRERNTYFQITDMNLNGNYFEDRNFYAQINSQETFHSVWVGVDTTGLGSSSVALLSDIENFVYDLGINFYKSEVQQEIDESEKAEQFMLRQQNRLNRDSVSLQNQLQSNEKELIRLQEAIEANKIEHEELLKKIETNHNELDNSIISLDKIRKTLDVQRKKKDKIK